jgi:hypothetical protein
MPAEAISFIIAFFEMAKISNCTCENFLPFEGRGKFNQAMDL